MMRFYLVFKIVYFFGQVETMGWLLMSDLPWLLGVNLILFVFYISILNLTKGKKQVTLVLLMYCISYPTDIIIAYLRYHDWLFILVGLIESAIVCIYLAMLRNQIEYLQDD